MKAVVIEEPGSVSLRELAVPSPAPGFARIRVKAAAICATDLEVLDGRIPANYPITPGHEWSGIVDAVGSAEDEAWVGKRVIGSNDVVCLKCDACRRGEWRYCADFEEIGFKRNGAYAEYFCVPVYGLCELPENISYEVGALCEPLGVALGTLDKTDSRFGESLLIFGAGSIGLCMLAVGKAIGMKNITVCATSNKRLALAKQLGADYTLSSSDCNVEEEAMKIAPSGFDTVIDATGIEDCISSSLRLARRGGTVALAGYGRGKIMSIRIDDIHIKNLRVVGAGNNWNMHKKAVSLMESGKVDLSSFVSDKLSLEDYARGFELARKRPQGFVKAVFVI